MTPLSARPRDLYVACDGTGRHKVGITDDVGRRMRQLGWKLRRTVVAVHVEHGLPMAEAVEIAAHWALLDSHDHSEWFSVDAQTAVEAVVRARAAVERGDVPTSRPLVNQRRSLGVRFEAGIEEARRPGETRLDFIREAVERELKRRARAR